MTTPQPAALPELPEKLIFSERLAISEAAQVPMDAECCRVIQATLDYISSNYALAALRPQAVPMRETGSPGLKRHAIDASDQLARYAAAPFFPDTEKRGIVRPTTPEWWDGLAELIETAQPLIARAQDEFTRAHHGITQRADAALQSAKEQ